MSTESKSIKKKLEDIHSRVMEPGSQLGKTLSGLAIKAIYEGRNSNAWKKYMRQIVGPGADKQFKRLTFQDNDNPPEYVRISNAYIVANAVCGSQTQTQTLKGIDSLGSLEQLDAGVPSEPYDVPPPPEE